MNITENELTLVAHLLSFCLGVAACLWFVHVELQKNENRKNK